MKLTKTELTYAKDRQLHAIGLTRTGNAGWMAKAMLREFTPQQMEAFHAAGIRKLEASEIPQIWRCEITGPDGARTIIEMGGKEELFAAIRNIVS